MSRVATRLQEGGCEGNAAAFVDKGQARWTVEAGEEHVEEHVDDPGLFD